MRFPDISIILIALFLVLVVVLPVSNAQTSASWWGNVTIVSGGTTNTSTDGAKVEALINNVSKANTTVGQFTSGYYLVDLTGGNTNDNVTFRVYGIEAHPTNATPQNYTAGDHGQLNLLVHLVANTGACPLPYPGNSGTTHAGCAGGYCVHGYCRAASTHCGDGFCDSDESSSSCSADCGSGSSGGSGGGGGGGGGGSSDNSSSGGGGGSSGGGGTEEEPPPEEESPKEGEVTLVDVPLTDSGLIAELLTAISPQTLGIQDLSPDAVNVKQIGTASLSTTTEEMIASLDSALAVASDPQAKNALTELKNNILAATEQPVRVDTLLEVFEIKSKLTGRMTKVSKITLTFTVNEDKKAVNIIEIIPKSVAQSANEITFIQAQPSILQNDPIVEWKLWNVKAGDKTSLFYMVNKDLGSIETTTLSSSEGASALACQPGTITCIDGSTLGTCRTDGSGYDTTSCPAGCEADACKPAQPWPVELFVAGLIIIVIALLAVEIYIKKRKKHHYAFAKS